MSAIAAFALGELCGLLTALGLCAFLSGFTRDAEEAQEQCAPQRRDGR